MRQTGFWANVSLLVTSLILLLAWGMLPLFTTDQPAVIESLYLQQSTEQGDAPRPSTIALYGAAVIAQMDRLDPVNMANDRLFEAAWSLVAVAGIGGVISGTLALWWPNWTTHAAFAGVVCGVASLVCLGFARFQYANMTATSLFDSTSIGWWVLVAAGAGLVGQGVWGRPRLKRMIAVPQPPPFLAQSPQEIFAAIPTDLSAAMRSIPRLRLAHLGTDHVYSFDLLQPVSIGRSRQNDIVLSDEKVSRRHAVIRWHEGWMLITNQSQHAPLYINQYPIDGEQTLAVGDIITMGQTHLRLTSD
jgi:hypothetical protein